nr:hypothetical protein CFP56_06550 [Quercus suber]
MYRDVGYRVAKEIEDPISVDVPKSGQAYGPFLRIRVNVDITKPLMREGGNADKRLASIPKAPSQMGQVTSELQVGKSELANLVRNDVDDTKLMKNCAEPVKPMSVLGKDFKKQLAEIDAGIHGEVSQMMKGEGSEKKVQESSKGQSHKHTHTPLGVSDASVVNDAWERGRNMGTNWPLLHCLEECRTSLTKRNKHSFGHIGKQITELQKKLQLLENLRGSESVLEDIYNMKMELNRWLNVEEEMRH